MERWKETDFLGINWTWLVKPWLKLRKCNSQPVPRPALAPLCLSYSPRVFFTERSSDHTKVSLVANFSHQVSNVCVAFLPSSLFIIYSHSSVWKKWTKTLSKGHFTALGSCIQESNVWSKASWGALFSYHHPTDDGEWQITCQSQHTRQGARLPGVLSFLAPAKALLRMKEWFINSSHWSQSIIEAADQPGLYSGCSRWCL